MHYPHDTLSLVPGVLGVVDNSLRHLVTMKQCTRRSSASSCPQCLFVVPKGKRSSVLRFPRRPAPQDKTARERASLQRTELPIRNGAVNGGITTPLCFILWGRRGKGKFEGIRDVASGLEKEGRGRSRKLLGRSPAPSKRLRSIVSRKGE